jgi:hypothetical protein
VEIGVKPAMVGHVLGEFAPNRVPVIHFRKKRQQARTKKLKTEQKPGPQKRVVDTQKPKTKTKKLSKMHFPILFTPKGHLFLAQRIRLQMYTVSPHEAEF